jgi:membrane fusion protein, multidrug efflux system
VSDLGSRPAPHAESALFATPPGGRPPRQTTLGSWLWPAVIVAVVVLGVWWIISNNKPAQPGGPGGGRRGGGVTTVAVVPAETGEFPVYATALGTVTPEAVVTVRTQISGQLMSVGFREGQIVSKGQFLAQIDPRPYQQALVQAEGTLAKDQASLANAKLDYNRYKTLYAQDSVSQQQLDTQGALVRQLEGQVKTDQAAVGVQKLNLTYARITAPVAGRVGLRQVDAGNYVTAGDTNGLVSVVQVTPIDVVFTLPETQAPQVARRLAQGAHLPVIAYDRDQQTPLAKGEFLSLDNLIDTTTGTVRAKARFVNEGSALFPNQFVNVRLQLDTLHNVVIVPTSAILRGQQGLYVFVADAQHAVHIRPVQVGPAAGEKTAVLSGLSAGETVVTDGSDRLREGACVIIGRPAGQGPGGPGGWTGRRGGGGQGSAPGAESAAAKPGLFDWLFGAKKPDQTAMKGGFGGGACGGGKGGSGSGQAWTGGGQGGGSVDRQAAGQGASQAGGQGAGQGGARTAALLDQLDLNPQQRAKADALFAAAREKAQASAGDDPDARRAAIRTEMAAAFAQLEPMLTPAQKAKLTALRAQMANRQGGQGQGGQGQGPANP